ncbi:MAG: hypothetical protein AABY32_00995 [Nanoarchaeota archaeon]
MKLNEPFDAYIDSEHQLDHKYAESLGLKIKKKNIIIIDSFAIPDKNKENNNKENENK